MGRRSTCTKFGKIELIKREGSSKWTICWYDPERKRMRYRATSTSSHSEAEVQLSRFIAERTRAREANPARFQPEIEPCVSEENAHFPKASLVVDRRRGLRHLLNKYLDALRSDNAPSLQQCDIAIKHLLRIIGDVKPDDYTLSKSVQQQYVDERSEAGVSASTISRELSVLRSALRGAAEVGVISNVPRIFEVEGKAVRTRWLSEDELESLLTAADTPRTQHIFRFIKLSIMTGARPSALLDLTWDRVTFLEDRVVVDLLVTGGAQTKKMRPTVTIEDPATITMLQTAYRMRRTEYVIEWGGYAVDSVKSGFRSAVKRAGLGSDVTPYVLRHSAATHMAIKGVPMWDIAGYLGHKDTRMVEKHYAHFHPDYQKKARRALADLGGRLPQSEHNAHVARTASKTNERLKVRGVSAMRQDCGDKFSPQVQNGSRMSHAPKLKKSRKSMVGAAGIEPATPTMST